PRALCRNHGSPEYWDGKALPPLSPPGQIARGHPDPAPLTPAEPSPPRRGRAANRGRDTPRPSRPLPPGKGFHRGRVEFQLLAALRAVACYFTAGNRNTVVC